MSDSLRSSRQTFRCHRAAKRSGGSLRSIACVDCTMTPRATGGKVIVEVTAPDSVVVENGGADGDPRLGTVGVPSDRVAAIAFARAEHATVITVPARPS